MVPVPVAAFHEAGHAVVAVRLRVAFSDVRVSLPRDPTDGFLLIRRPHLPSRSWTVRLVKVYCAGSIAERTMLANAGRLDEANLASVREGAADDEEKIRPLLPRVLRRGETGPTAYKRLRRETALILADDWDAVVALAVALASERRIYRRAAGRIIRAALAARK